jgi:Uma2 family endonuclease
MSGGSKEPMTPAEYLAFERQSEQRHEYYRGEIFAMAGASLAHNRITSNILFELQSQFRERPCDAFVIDMRTKIPNVGLYTYPDIVALCGEPEFEDNVFDTLTNPQMVIEVLSPSTESYDRGQKFQFYRQNESLTDYLLVAQNRLSVEHFRRQPSGEWLLRGYTELDDVIQVESLDCSLSLKEIYLKVDFKEDEK